MINLPESVKIGWKTYHVEVWNHDVAQARLHYGQCDHSASTIRIDTHFGDEQTLETFLHEIFHAFIDVGGMHQMKTKNFDEEPVVKYCASWLMTVLSDNPQVADLIHQLYRSKE